MSEIALPHGYSEEDIARGFTTGPGRTPGVAEKKAIPADILLVVELRHLRALLERWGTPAHVLTVNGSGGGDALTAELKSRVEAAYHGGRVEILERD